MPSKLLPTEPTYSSGTTAKGEYLSVGERKMLFKKGKITGAAFKRGSSVGGAENVAGGGTGGGAIVRAGAPGAIQQAADISQSPVTPSLLNAVQAIAASVDNIVGILKDQVDAQKDAAEDARVAGEEKAGRAREKGLETNVFSGLKKTGEKIMKPVKSLWDKLLNFFTTIFLGRAIIKIIEWFSDEANQEKISTLFRFLKDWWPALVAGLMLFLGPGLLSAVGLVALLVWGVPKIIDVAKYIWELPGKIFAFLKGGPGGDNKIDTQTTPSGVSRQDARHGGLGDKGEEAPVDLEMGENLKEDASQLQELPAEMAQGGQVPGSGNKDTVPAMLTPGEFVMSKGAVSKWGAGTMASMNAAGGGTNRPSVMNHYSGGGTVIKPPTTNFNVGKVMGYRGGGVVKGGDTMNISLAPSQRGPAEISPPTSGRIRVMQAEAAAAEAKSRTTKQPGQQVPEFSASTMISPYKIKTLGITV